jgi:glycosyl transferase family 87
MGQVLEHASAPAATGATGPGRPGRTPGWLPRGDRARAAFAVIRREWVAGAFAVSAIFALVTTLTSSNAPERAWGTFAAVSYAVAAVTAAMVRRRGVSLAVLISLAGALAAPLAWMAVTGVAQPEIAVIVRSAAMLVHQGTPYAGPAALAAAHSWRAYDPYLPALIVFGIPRVFAAGLLGDPRIWLGVVFVATFGAAVRIARVPRPAWWTVLVTASPMVALPLAVGGDDLPVLGLMCLGLALASRGSRGQWRWAAGAGLALGLATAMKATAWPAVAVVAVLLIARQGWRAATWFAAAVLGVALAIDGPTVAAHPAAALANTVLYPLGLAKVASPAASVLPGHLLASTGAVGHWAALVLMALAGAGVGAWMIVRPPRDAHGAGCRLALGLALVFVLAPASRVGYFVYPLGLAAWLLPSRWPELPGDLSVDPEPQYGWYAVQGHHRIQHPAARLDDGP